MQKTIAIKHIYILEHYIFEWLRQYDDFSTYILVYEMPHTIKEVSLCYILTNLKTFKQFSLGPKWCVTLGRMLFFFLYPIHLPDGWTETYLLYEKL